MIETGATPPIPGVIQLDSPLTLSLSRKGRGNGAARYGSETKLGACSEVVPSPLAGEGGREAAG